MSSFEQENFFPDEQEVVPSDGEHFVDLSKRKTIRRTLGALITIVGIGGAYKGSDFISHLVGEKDKALKDAKEARTALEKQRQEKDIMLRAYREIVYQDVIGSLTGHLDDSQLNQALTTIDQSPDLAETLKKEMLTSAYESRIDSFTRMHEAVQPIVISHFAKESDNFRVALFNILAYATSKGALTVNAEDIKKDQYTFDEVDRAFAELSDSSATVLVPGYKDFPPVVVKTSDLFLQRLNNTSFLIYSNKARGRENYPLNSQYDPMRQVQSVNTRQVMKA